MNGFGDGAALLRNTGGETVEKIDMSLGEGARRAGLQGEGEKERRGPNQVCVCGRGERRTAGRAEPKGARRRGSRVEPLRGVA